jgi:hypothetical protein
MKNKATNLIGWLGVLLVVSAYILISFEILTPKDIWYQLLNALGALGIVIETFSKKDYQPFWLNIVWLGIAILAIVKIL